MSWTERLGGYLPEMPTLGREAEIAVYLIHNSGDAEDYFFLFDFEEFVDRSKGGLFVRPVLRVFAGRDDFSRTFFARRFREVFSAEFDRLRAEIEEKANRRGWLSWGMSTLAAGVAGIFILAIALGTGWLPLAGGDRVPVKSATSKGQGSLSRRNWLGRRSAEAKLADEIESTKSKVETALAALDVSLHPELLEHAERVGETQKRADLDRDAWPLPEYVRAHLRDGESGSWW
ncbi:hypothetical protein [Gymnodinialimonas hymeniacidonis]|uniref:hypothetical protein n=1 Tax=Gymnodinialimonas hymeniacidonis TaxID=3126508 RepID=UPI0034C68317